ncbi:MAG: hypothetical protein QOE44_743 [Solirubrobacteraceae bacterium]|nr:hypothetical protein [Solirubrobacteraceae bacterium]
MELYEVMGCAPSTRTFTDEPVEREPLGRVLDAARFAPSGGNRQGWRVVVVEDAGTRRALRELYVPHWERYLEATGMAAELADGEAGRLPARRRRSLEGADRYARSFDEAPVHLVVWVELGALAIVDAKLERPSIAGGASVYPFVQNVLLGLRAEGLGAAFTTLLAPAEEAVRDLLGVPEGMALAGHIGVGHRRDPWPRRLTRRPVEEFAFAERYGEPWAGAGEDAAGGRRPT